MGAVSSVVKKATGEVYALKTMPTDPWVDDAELAIATLLDEVRVQQALDHPNIARIFDVFGEPAPEGTRHVDRTASDPHVGWEPPGDRELNDPRVPAQSTGIETRSAL